MLFLAAIGLTLIVSQLLRDTPGYVLRGPDETYQGDIIHYIYWTRLVTQHGIQAAYSGTWPETYAVYPPVTLYGFELVGSVYRALQDPSFELDRALDSLWLREAIKGMALAWHLLAAAGIYLVVRRRFGSDLAGWAGAAYVANPAALFDVGHWAQPDGAHSLFSVLAVGLLGAGQVAGGWAALALAALAKPQAWAILPLLAMATLRLPNGRRRLLRGALVGLATAALVVSPFIVTGRLSELLTLPGTIASVMPVVSADAHNFWWLVLERRGLDPLFVLDTTRLGGPFTYRLVAGALVLAQFGMTYWLYLSGRASLAESAALGALGWFVFTTQAHENHLFFALPLLALAWPARRGLLVPFVLLSCTVLLNMALHDQLLLERWGFRLQDPVVDRLRLINAATNVLCFLGWTLWALVRPLGVAFESNAQREQRRPTWQESRAPRPG